MMPRATTVAEAVPLIVKALAAGPGRLQRLAGLSWSLSLLTSAQRMEALAQVAQQPNIADQLRAMLDRYDPRAGHCMHGDTRANCFAAPCALCPDHPENVRRKVLERERARLEAPASRPADTFGTIRALGSLWQRFTRRR